MRTIAQIVTLFVLAVPTFARAQPSLDASQQARYQKLCESLVAPCCWSESVAMHRSPQVLQARDEVAALILQGKSDQEILDDFVARYGVRVLIEPAGGSAHWLYVLPVLALLAGALWAMGHLLNLGRRPRPQGAATSPPPAPDDSEWEW